MTNIHLLVLIHGMWGHPVHVGELARHAREYPHPALPNSDEAELHVLVAETNREESTYDGIDWGGERVTQEITDEIEKLDREGKSVIRFSVTGYSLGGLVARYVVGILHQRKFFDIVKPVNFNTIATPHIGLLTYPSLFSRTLRTLGPVLLSRTGEQFYCVDKWSARGRPLLQVMADPERIFFQGLALFSNIRIYANAVNDRTVPYITSAIELEDPFISREENGLEVELDDKYSPLIKSYTLPPLPPPTTRKTWSQKITHSLPPLPPFLDFRFPLNIAIYAVLPIVMPVLFSLVIVRLSVASRSSRARLLSLEKEESNTSRLVHVIAQLEKEMEDTVADFVDEPNGGPSSATLDGGTLDPGYKEAGKARSSSSLQPNLTPLQRQQVSNLNKLPNLKKELAYIDPARNSHAIIICRDVDRFEYHRRGEGLLRHWVDQFLL